MEREGEMEELSRRKQTRLLEGREEEQTCKQSFVKKFFPKSNFSPRGSCKLMGGGGVTDSHAPNVVVNLKSNPIIDKVNRKNETPRTADGNILISEERQQNYDAHIFTPNKRKKFSNNLNCWRQSTISGISDFTEPSGELARSLTRNSGPGRAS